MKGIKMTTDIAFADGDYLTINAESYRAYRDKYLPDWTDNIQNSKHKIIMVDDQRRQEGNVEFRKMILSKGIPLKVFAGSRYGYANLTDDVSIPIMMMNGSTWMSFTPMEIISQRAGLRLAKGNVMIGGLGMGWLAQAVAEKKSVTSVTVFETNPVVLDWFSDHVAKKLGDKFGGIIEQDAYEAAYEGHHKYDSILFDIWEGYGTAYDEEKFNMLKGEVKSFNGTSIWGWGDIKNIPSPMRYFG